MKKRVTKVKRHLSEAEVAQKIRNTVGFWRVQKWLVIWNALVDPRPAAEIALHTGVAKQTVHNLVSNYNRQGAEVVEGPGKGGRRHCYLSFEQEAAFLEPFKEKALFLSGEIATVKEIQAAFQKRLGKVVHKTTIYRLLHRHGWRKIAPRPLRSAALPLHVQSKVEKQQDFKKNSLK